MIALRRFATSGLMVWFLVTIAGVYFLANLKENIKFGIDLVGGTYITLDVHTEKALENDLFDRAQHIIHFAKKEFKISPVSTHVDPAKAVLTFADATAAQTVEQALLLNNPAKAVIVRDGAAIHISLSEQARNEVIRDAVQSNISALRVRLDQSGVGEITIAAQGDKNIIIELPNVHNPAQAKAMIGRSALLEIKLVHDMGSSEEEIARKHGDKIPEDMIVVKGRTRGNHHAAYYLVPKHTDLTGRLLKSAHADPYGGEFGAEPVVAFEFKAEGGEKFYELTCDNVGRNIAVIIDGVVITAPTVNVPLSTSGVITGNFALAEAQELAALLKSGAFVAPVSFAEERQIGPSLGAESIQRGLMSCALGFALLCLFSLIFYKVAGIFAILVLVYNLLLILFFLSWMGATLTLPGIAGMILTIGMAIDASILIYERIREELALGAPLRKAIDAGFSGALAVIIDANVTHFLVALVLYKLGAGPIQGFAVTMIIGIVSTLLTGLLLLKSIFNFYCNILGAKTLKI